MKKFKYVVILLFSAALLSSATWHKFYVSVTLVEYVKDKQSLQLISRIFIDDIEKLIRERYDESITLAEKDESDMIDVYVERYLKEKLLININENPVVINFLGREYEDDIMVCYIEIEGVSSIKYIEIENNVFFDVFEDQQNIVRTKINGKQKSFILTKGKNKGMLNFN